MKKMSFGQKIGIENINFHKKTAKTYLIMAYFTLVIINIALSATIYLYKFKRVSVVNNCPLNSVATIEYKPNFSAGEFVQRYINKYHMPNPNIALNLPEAYEMMTTRLQKIRLAEKVDAGRIQKDVTLDYQGDFYIDKMEVKGEFQEGETAYIRGTGSFYMRPVKGFAGNYKEAIETKVFFQVNVIMTKVKNDFNEVVTIPLVDYDEMNYFKNEDLLKAFMLKRNIKM